MTSPQFEIRPSLIKGDPADAYLHWTKEVMRLESLNPVVTMDLYASSDGVLCGVEEVKALLKSVLPQNDSDNPVETLENEVQVWALDEGEVFTAGEPLIRIIARYASFSLYETSLCGILSSCIGWATAARKCVEAAGDTTVIGYGLSLIHI